MCTTDTTPAADTPDTTVETAADGGTGAMAFSGVAEIVATGLALIAATGSGALLFSESSKGKDTFPELLRFPGVPAFVLLVGVLAAALRFDWRRLRTGVLFGAVAGLAGTVGLEIVRHIGFRVFEAMPGDLPRLMGVKATDRIMSGPNRWSDVVGYADHFWNGAAFGITFALLVVGLPATRRWNQAIVASATLYGLVLGIGFALGPVPKSLGVGGPFATVTVAEFRATVYLAHLLFGLVLGVVLVRFRTRRRFVANGAK